jgi:hypothetical protein
MSLFKARESWKASLRSNAGEVEEFDRDGSSAGDVDNDSRDTSRLASRRAMRVLPVCIRHEGE